MLAMSLIVAAVCCALRCAGLVPRGVRRVMWRRALLLQANFCMTTNNKVVFCYCIDS